MDSLKKNRTHDLVKLLNGKKTLKNKWLFRLKQEDNSQSRYKGRLVVKGFNNKKRELISRKYSSQDVINSSGA